MDDWIRRQALRELFGYDPRGERPARWTDAGDQARRILKKFVAKEQIYEGEIRAAWKEIVGDFLAAHSAPVQLRDGILVVQVLQPTVHYELDRVWRTRILARLRQRFGASSVRDLKFRIS